MFMSRIIRSTNARTSLRSFSSFFIRARTGGEGNPPRYRPHNSSMEVHSVADILKGLLTTQPIARPVDDEGNGRSGGRILSDRLRTCRSDSSCVWGELKQKATVRGNTKDGAKGVAVRRVRKNLHRCGGVQCSADRFDGHRHEA